jgi:amidase
LNDEALAAADAADVAFSTGDALGPLHGVPFTVKENIAVAGTPTTSGMVLFAEAIAPRDDPAVERLRASGAIPVGRTNLPDAALRSQTNSSLHGLTLNPWNPAHTAGGSSGGEGVALAVGMSPLGLGNDIGGSVRIPAHCCGVAAIKPTVGVVPALAMNPVMLCSQLMAVTGVMARHVEDLVAGLRAVAGQHSRDPRSVPALLVEMPDAPLRIALLDLPSGMSVDPQISAAVASAANTLASAGHTIIDDITVPFAATAALWSRLLAPELVAQRHLAVVHLDAGVVSFMDAVIARQPHVDANTWSSAFAERFRHNREWAKLFEQVDIVLAPTLTAPAMDLDADIATPASAQATLDAFAPTMVASVAGIPAATVPIAVVADMPISVQILAGHFRDLVALGCAQVLEDQLGTITPIEPRTAARL